MDGNFVNVLYLFDFYYSFFLNRKCHFQITMTNGILQHVVAIGGCEPTVNQLEPLIFQMICKTINQIFTNKYTSGMYTIKNCELLQSTFFTLLLYL